jgi:tetratricopeptide (TPR) repeat protein
MGIVYEAVQLTLHRRVALKVLLVPASLDPKRLQRFQQEARAAASLHHTNIVPVFGIGCEADLHFYAMQYIQGQSLDAVIRALRTASAPGPSDPDRPSEAPPPSHTPAAETLQPAQETLALRSGDRRAYCRAVARLGVQAAGALDYAHDQGVIHRDIKPGNLLLDGRGTLWITDFGTAHFPGGAGLTETGDLLGTLRYMSPEQARGKRGVLDERTDLYSLGVTLYELATLKPAFPAQDRQELLEQITSCEPVPPRRLNPAMPRELETILLKAIARAPEERYQTGREMADDLRRFLEDKPIRARRPGLVERLVKWSRRHRGVVRALGAGLVLAVVALAGSTAWVWQANRRAEAAYRAEAESRRRAREAADEMWAFADSFLAGQPHLEERHLAFLSRTLQFYQEEAAAGRVTDPRGRSQQALAHKRVADIQLLLGRDREAEQGYARAVEQFRALTSDFPDDTDSRLELARCHAALATILGQTGSAARAEEAHRRALFLAEELVSRSPSDPRYLVALAVFRGNLATFLTALSRHEEAEALFQQASPVAERLVKEFPREPIYRNRLAGVYHRWGELAVERGDLVRGEERLRRARALLERLAADHPEEVSYRAGLAGLSRRLAEILPDRQDTTEAEALLRQSVTALDELRRYYPGRYAYREEQVPGWEALGHLSYRAGKPDQAREAFARAVQLLEGLIDQRPGRKGYHVRLAWLLADCPCEALRDPARAIDLARAEAALDPGSAGTATALGAAYYRAGRWRDAVATLEAGVTRQSPERVRAWLFLAMSYERLGEGRKARSCYERAVEGWGKNEAHNPELVRLRSEAGKVLKVP